MLWGYVSSVALTTAFSSVAIFQPEVSIYLSAKGSIIKDQIRAIMASPGNSVLWDEGNIWAYRIPGDILRGKRMIVFSIDDDKETILKVRVSAIATKSGDILKNTGAGILTRDVFDIQRVISALYACSVATETQKDTTKPTPHTGLLHAKPYREKEVQQALHNVEQAVQRLTANGKLTEEDLSRLLSKE